MKRTTIYEVANAAGVSLATVSRVINGSNVVREDTKKRVEAVIRELGYKPNAMAQSLAMKKSTSVALVISEDSIYNNGQTLNGLTDVAKIYKYSIILYVISEGVNSMNEAIDAMIKNRVDGAVVFDDKFTQEQLDMLREFDIQVVTVGNKDYQGEFIGNVRVGFDKMAYQLAKKYLALGKKDIILVEDRKNKFVLDIMKNAMQKAYREANLEFNGFVEIPSEYRASYSYLKEYFSKNEHEVVIAYRDSQAIAVINALNENNKIENTEIICAVDTKYNGVVRPSVSGFKIPQYDLGAIAMRVLTKMLSNKDGEEEVDFEKNVELGYFFNKRSTTKE